MHKFKFKNEEFIYIYNNSLLILCLVLSSCILFQEKHGEESGICLVEYTRGSIYIGKLVVQI